MIDTDDTESVCGETYDHNLRPMGPTEDGCTNYECIECGAEIWEDEDGDYDE